MNRFHGKGPKYSMESAANGLVSTCLSEFQIQHSNITDGEGPTGMGSTDASHRHRGTLAMPVGLSLTQLPVSSSDLLGTARGYATCQNLFTIQMSSQHSPVHKS